MKLTEEEKAKNNFISPAKVLKEIHLKPGEVVVDYGSGPGHWSLPAAQIVGPKGHVYAIDNNIDILSILKSHAEIQNLTNIDTEELNLEKGSSKFDVDADLVIIANVLHLIENKDELVARASKLLGDSGRVLIIDWIPDNRMFGPVKEQKINVEDVVMIAERADLALNCTVDAGWHHFGLVFEKKGVNNAKKED